MEGVCWELGGNRAGMTLALKVSRGLDLYGRKLRVTDSCEGRARKPSGHGVEMKY